MQVVHYYLCILAQLLQIELRWFEKPAKKQGWFSKDEDEAFEAWVLKIISVQSTNDRGHFFYINREGCSLRLDRAALNDNLRQQLADFQFELLAFCSERDHM